MRMHSAEELKVQPIVLLNDLGATGHSLESPSA